MPSDTADSRAGTELADARTAPSDGDDVAAADAVCFDMDGVFLVGPTTPASVYADAADAALDELALGADPDADQLSVLRGYGYDGSLETACRDLGVDPARFWECKEAHACRISRERIRAGERALYDDVEAVAAVVERAPSALVSNNRQATAEFVADHLGFGFDAVRGRAPTPESYRRRKPDPDFLSETLADLGVDGGVYVGDSPKDVTAAAAAGLDPLFLRRPHNEGVSLPDGTAYELDSLVDLPAVLDER